MLETRTRDTKTKFSKFKPALKQAAVCLFLIIALGVAGDIFVSAQSVDSLKREQQEKQAKLDALNKQIKEQQTQINQLVNQTNTLQRQIAIFTAQINQATAQIAATETKIEITNAEIAGLSSDIAQKQSDIVQTKEALGALLHEMYQNDRSGSTILTLMNNDNLSDFLNAVEQIQNLQGQSFELLQEIKSLKLKLEDDRNVKEKKRNDLKKLEEELLERRQVLNEQVSAKNDILKQTKGQEAIYRQLLAQKEAQQSQIEQEIQNLDSQIRKKLGQRVSPGRKGIFWWPMDGSLTQGYGNTGFTSLGYNFHNGIDLAAPAGEPIFAAASGTVMATGTGNLAYGNWAVVKHPNINNSCVITLYAHMLRISVKKGLGVVGGETIIGTEGNTGNTTRLLYGPRRGFHLHFTVFDCEGFQIVDGAHGNYQVPVGYTYNPMDFLK